MGSLEIWRRNFLIGKQMDSFLFFATLKGYSHFNYNFFLILLDIFFEKINYLEITNNAPGSLLIFLP